jgi:hypothetical protein
MVSVAVSVPPELVAVTVYACDADSAVGVPDNSPDDVSKLRPAGSAGDMLQEVAAPPLLEGVIESIASPTIKSNTVVEYEMLGAESSTVNESVVESVPPVFVAEIV